MPSPSSQPPAQIGLLAGSTGVGGTPSCDLLSLRCPIAGWAAPAELGEHSPHSRPARSSHRKPKPRQDEATFVNIFEGKRSRALSAGRRKPLIALAPLPELINVPRPRNPIQLCGTRATGESQTPEPLPRRSGWEGKTLLRAKLIPHFASNEDALRVGGACATWLRSHGPCRDGMLACSI